MLKIILNNNNFAFRGEKFLQVQGTAMGCPFGPSYANIFLTDWEEKLLLCDKHPSFWIRFIDDVFLTWDFSQSELFVFCDFVNNLFPTINVEMSFDLHKMRYLDLLLYKSNHKVLFRVDFKPTDTHCILSQSSFHPPHVFRSILFSQIYRWATHCATYEDFKSVKNIVQPRWMAQGYSRNSIRDAVRKVLGLTWQSLTAWETGFFPCDCDTCLFGIGTKSVVSSVNNNKFLIVHRLTCKSENVIYLILCKRCKVQYVGQTSRPVSRRIAKHLRNIKTFYCTSVSKHFTESCMLSDFSFVVLEHCPDEKKRLKKENRWIKRQNTLHPNGLNQELNKLSDVHLIVPYSHCSNRVIRYCQKQLSTCHTNICQSLTMHPNLCHSLSVNR